MIGQPSISAKLIVQMQLSEMHNMATLLHNFFPKIKKDYKPSTFKRKLQIQKNRNTNSKIKSIISPIVNTELQVQKIEHIPIPALYPQRARLLMDAIPNPLIHSLVESPNLKAVDLTPTFKSSSLS